MQKITPEEIINFKILPFNIYSEFGEKIFAAGETLTPGKLLQIKHMETLYRDEENVDIQQEEPTKNQDLDLLSLNTDVLKQNNNNEKVDKPANKQNTKQIINEENLNNKNIIVENFDMKPSTIIRNKLSIDDIDISGYNGPINKQSKIEPQTQLKIKAFFFKTIETLDQKPPMETLSMFANIRDKIVQDIILNDSNIMKSSQLKLLGEYNRCHALNTAILAGAVAKHMDLSEQTIYNIVLAGLLHDIGKNKLPENLLSKTSLTANEQREIQNHTKIGYRILRAEMDIPENIARVALDHHEMNDGTGYPAGKSGESINVETQIIAVCNYFDNLTSNRTSYQIKNTKEALKVILRMGTKKFSADALYTFVHMFSYNDTVNFEEMLQQ